MVVSPAPPRPPPPLSLLVCTRHCLALSTSRVLGIPVEKNLCFSCDARELGGLRHPGVGRPLHRSIHCLRTLRGVPRALRGALIRGRRRGLPGGHAGRSDQYRGPATGRNQTGGRGSILPGGKTGSGAPLAREKPRRRDRKGDSARGQGKRWPGYIRWEAGGGRGMGRGRDRQSRGRRSLGGHLRAQGDVRDTGVSAVFVSEPETPFRDLVRARG